jgi:hypothetical protein
VLRPKPDAVVSPVPATVALRVRWRACLPPGPPLARPHAGAGTLRPLKAGGARLQMPGRTLGNGNRRAGRPAVELAATEAADVRVGSVARMALSRKTSCLPRCSETRHKLAASVIPVFRSHAGHSNSSGNDIRRHFRNSHFSPFRRFLSCETMEIHGHGSYELTLRASPLTSAATSRHTACGCGDYIRSAAQDGRASERTAEFSQHPPSNLAFAQPMVAVIILRKAWGSVRGPERGVDMHPTEAPSSPLSLR